MESTAFGMQGMEVRIFLRGPGGRMYQGFGEAALQAACEGFDSLRLHFITSVAQPAEAPDLGSGG